MKPKQQRKAGRFISWLLVLLLLASYATWAVVRPLPMLQPSQQLQKTQSTAEAQLSWPPNAQAAVGIAGSSEIVTQGAQTPTPMASTAKIITALTVLDKKPITAGQQGPTITLTDADVARYNAYVAQDGSVTPVQAGEKLTEYQMLQAIMLPSANNIADSLAIWAFGSLEAYSQAANAYLQTHNLTQTKVGAVDASGLSPTTTSTAKDLVMLGKLAMDDPVLAEIVNQKTAVLPVANTVKNVNFLLGTSNIVGVKTGNTDEAGGVFVGAARTTVDGKPVTYITAVAGAPDLFASMKYSLNLIDSAQLNTQNVAATSDNQTVGSYVVPWGGSIKAIADDPTAVTAWRKSAVATTTTLRPITPEAKAKTAVGRLTTANQALGTKSETAVVLSQSVPKPSLVWRLTHPF